MVLSLLSKLQDLEEMMRERGLTVDHVTVFR
jgi:transposase-like protein